MQVCTSIQADNHARTSPLSLIYRPDALPATKPTRVKKCMEYEVEGPRPRGRPNRTWKEVVEKLSVT